MKTNIKTYGASQLKTRLQELGEPAYRAGQVAEWLYARQAGSFEEMTNLSKGLREKLASEYAIILPRLIQREVSSDGSRKYLIEVEDNDVVECVGIPEENRLTVCFSTQVGCAMGCVFCATGAQGFKRSLGPGEMIDQLNVVSNDFDAKRITNAVAMGQGEPFANYDATISAMRFMNNPKLLGIGARHITVSTCGVLSGIGKLEHEPEQFTLAVSLHSAVQSTRDKLLPAMRTQPLNALRDRLVENFDKSGRRPTLEVALIDGINDTPEELDALCDFAAGCGFHINLIPLNAVGGSLYMPSKKKRIKEFQTHLQEVGIETSVRTSRGGDIHGACGQLSGLPSRPVN